MKTIPGRRLEVSSTEITQKLYKSITGGNPSYLQGENLPVENVSWYDAIYFCNKLSIQQGLPAAYSVNKITDPELWKYEPNKGNFIKGIIDCNFKCGGYRLPTEQEWEYAAKGGKTSIYAGNDTLEETAWYIENSGDETHHVGKKKANGYGLYDMSGNVWEWCWGTGSKYLKGGSYHYSEELCRIKTYDMSVPYNHSSDIGFRIVRTNVNPQEEQLIENFSKLENIGTVKFDSQNITFMFHYLNNHKDFFDSMLVLQSSEYGDNIIFSVEGEQINDYLSFAPQKAPIAVGLRFYGYKIRFEKDMAFSLDLYSNEARFVLTSAKSYHWDLEDQRFKPD